MRDPRSTGQHAMLSEALTNLQSALETLDRASAPAHIGAHVDLAIHELIAALAVAARAETRAQMDRNAEPQ